MSKKANIIFLILFLSLFLLVFSGCQKQQTARDFYIDAVMLNELNQKDNATEKLNAAVKINPKYSIAYSMLGDIYLEKKEYEKVPLLMKRRQNFFHGHSMISSISEKIIR